MRAHVALLALACDASYAGFLNAVPVSDEGGGPVHVYLGVDGVSRAAFDEARARGAFFGWDVADVVAAFPATSEYSWTRTLRTGSIPGYEAEYYDPSSNTIVNDGLEGLAEHPLREGLADPLPCWQRFDYLGNGDLWMMRGYEDPEAALPGALDELFNALDVRARRQPVFLAYLMNVDALGHTEPFSQSVAALVEIGRRVDEFESRHPGRFLFTLMSDHGNTHLTATLADLEQTLPDVGIDAVKSLAADDRLEAVVIVHTRVSYVALHTHPSRIAEVAERASHDPAADLVAAPLGGDGASRRYGVWRRGRRFDFAIALGGDVVLPDAGAWRDLGIDLGATGPVRLADRDAFDRTRDGPYPDPFYRIDQAFTSTAVDTPADVIVSMPDDVTSYGFHLPGGVDGAATDGFHGSLTRKSGLTVVATQLGPLPAALRGDDLADLFPEIRPAR